jgi:hypothetical protein
MGFDGFYSSLSTKILREIICIYLSKKIQMKLVSFLLFLLLITGFTACENHMDIDDIMPGTPSHADTVLPRKDRPAINLEGAGQKSLPKEYIR